MTERARAFLLMAVLVSVAATPSFGGQSKEKPLYDRLGGTPAITAVVDEFVARVAADTRINRYFASVASDPSRLGAFKGKLVDQICQASGGPCKYTGKDMKSAHAGMGITGAEFDALVEDLVATLNQFNVAKADQDALLTTLGAMRADIVERPGRETGSPLPASFRPAPPRSQDTTPR